MMEPCHRWLKDRELLGKECNMADARGCGIRKDSLMLVACKLEDCFKTRRESVVVKYKSQENAQIKSQTEKRITVITPFKSTKYLWM